MTDSPSLVTREAAGFPSERTFLGWSEPALHSAAARLAEHYAHGDELRMREATLALPGARAGRRLLELLVREAEERELRLVPPRVITVGSLPELLYPAARPVGSDALSRAVWARALRALPAKRLACLFPTAPAEDDLRGWARLSRTIASLHREVGGAGLRFADVGRRCAEGLLFNDADRWAVLAETEAHYVTALQELGFTDRTLGRIDALEAGNLALPSDLWLIGVVEMPGILHRMLESLPNSAARLHILVQAPEEEAPGFDALGAIRPEAWTGRAVPLVDEQIAVRDQPGDQAAEVTRSLAALDGRYAADEVVIAVPDPDLIPFLEQQLGDAGVSIRAAAGSPVARAPLARLLAAIADYLDQSSADTFAALVRHPDLDRWLERVLPAGAKVDREREDGWLEALDRYRAECLPTSMDEIPGGARRRGAIAVANVRDAVNGPRLLGRATGRQRLSLWVPEVMTLISEVYDELPLDRTRPADRRFLEVCGSLRDAASALHALPPSLDEECDASTALRLILDELSGAALAPEPDADAIELLGWLEMRLDDAPVAVVTGFNEPFLPESVNAHAFLPNALRERLGLVDNRMRYARDCYELTALLHSRAVVRLVAGRRSATGDPLRPSRLMLAVEGPALAERVKAFFSGPTGLPSSGPAQDDSPATGGFRMPAEPVIHAPEPITQLRVTDFRQLLADPYLFALGRILELTPLNDRPREMDGLRFGDVAHKVLEQFGGSKEANCPDPARVKRCLNGLLDEFVSLHFGSRPLPAVRIQVEQLRTRLEAFAGWQAARAAEGWQVKGVECLTPEGGVAFVVDGEPIHLIGRIDRVDYHPERKAWALFDYKTGDTGESPEETHRAGRKDDRRWTDLQLPLYRHLLPEVRDKGGRRPFSEGEPGPIELAYITLPRKLEDVRHLPAGWGNEELEEADECAREVVRSLRKNAFIFDPERARAARNGDLAPLLGLGSLESAEDTEEEE